MLKSMEELYSPAQFSSAYYWFRFYNSLAKGRNNSFSTLLAKIFVRVFTV